MARQGSCSSGRERLGKEQGTQVRMAMRLLIRRACTAVYVPAPRGGVRGVVVVGGRPTPRPRQAYCPVSTWVTTEWDPFPQA